MIADTLATHQIALHTTSGDPPVFRWVDRPKSLHKLQNLEDVFLATSPCHEGQLSWSYLVPCAYLRIVLGSSGETC